MKNALPHPALSGGTPNSSSWVCAATSDWGEKNFSNVVFQQVLYFLFDVALAAEKQISGGIRGSGTWERVSPLALLKFLISVNAFMMWLK